MAVIAKKLYYIVMAKTFHIERQTHHAHIRYALDQLCQDVSGDVALYYGTQPPLGFTGLFIQESNFWDVYGKQESLPHAVFVEPNFVVLYGTKDAPDIVASTFFMLSRYEELLNTTRDEYGRFPATATIAHTYNFIDRPIVDEYRAQLSRALQRLFPACSVVVPQAEVRFTHDVDKLKKSRREALLTEVKNILRGRVSGIPGFFYHLVSLKNPANTFEWFYKLEGQGIYYWMTQSEDGYTVESPEVQSLIQKYATYIHGVHPDRGEKLLAPVWQASGVSKARNHFLQFEVTTTWDEMADVGITDDSTLGFADRCGYRAGTCRPFRVFSLAQECVLPLTEYPLLMMDVTLWAYMQLSPVAAFKYVQRYAAQVKKYGGVFVLLWHNFACDEWRWRAFYKQTVAYLRNSVK